MKSQLENDPVFASFGDEKIRLEHLDVTKDVPRKSAFVQAIKLAKSYKDWENIPGLLEGYYRSKAKLQSNWLEKMIVLANEHGAMSVVIQALARVETNGFTLSIPIVRERILLEIRNNAKESKWSKKVTEKSSKYVDVVLNHMEHPKHCGSRVVTDQDPRAEPYVVAIPLELAAVQAQKFYDGEDKYGKVEMYSTRLLAALAQQKTQLSGNEAWQVPRDAVKPVQLKDSVASIDWLVTKFIPVRNALKLSLAVRGETWPEEERAFAVYLQKQIEEKLDLAEAEISKLTGREEGKITTTGLDEWKQEKGLDSLSKLHVH